MSSSNSKKQYAKYNSLGPKQVPKMPECMDIQDLGHRKKVITDNTVVCIDLYAKWCEPCKVISPKFAELAQKYNNPGKCLFVKEDVELELTRDCSINGIPAFIFYKNGSIVRNDNTPLVIVGGDLDKVEMVLKKLILA